MTYRLTDDEREALDETLRAEWPDDAYERGKFLERTVEAIVAREVAAVEAEQHDDQCESEYESGANAWTPCGCQASRSEAEGLAARAEAAEAKVAAVEALEARP